MKCIAITKTNGAPSALFENILDNIANGNESKARSLYSHFMTNMFVEDFGNYVASFKGGISDHRTDDNGEPRLFQEGDGSYYYLNRYNEKRAFPPNKSKLTQSISFSLLDPLINNLALNYLVEATGISTTNLDIGDTHTVGLTQYIRDVIENIDKKYQEDPKRSVSKALFNSKRDLFKNSVEDIAELVRMKYIGMNLNFKESMEEDLSLIENDTKDPGFNKNAFERSVGSNVRTNTKLLLSMIPDPVNTTKDMFGNTRYLPFDTVYGTLLNRLSDIYQLSDGQTLENPIDTVIERLEVLTQQRPEFVGILDLLKNPDTPQETKTSFYQAFNTQINNFIATELVFNEHRTKVSYATKNTTSTVSRSSTLRKDWNNNMLQKFLYKPIDESQKVVKEDSDGNSIEVIRRSIQDNAVEKFNEAASQFKAILSLVEKSKHKNLTTLVEETGEPLHVVINRQFREAFENMFGFKLHYETIPSLMSREGYNPQSSITNVLKRLTADLQHFSSRSLKSVIESGNTSINYLEKSAILKIIGDTNALFTKEDATSSIMSHTGPAYIHQNKQHIRTQIALWRKDPSILQRLYDTDPYVRGSLWARHLLALDSSIERRSDISKHRFKQFTDATLLDFYTSTSSSDILGTASKEADKIDYIVDNLNKVLTMNSNHTYTSRTMVAADKKTDIQLSIDYHIDRSLDKVDTNGNVTLKYVKGKENESVARKFTHYFLSEVNRMNKAKNIFKNDEFINDRIIHFHYNARKSNPEKGIFVKGNAFESQYFPSLSYNGSLKGLSPELTELAKSIRRKLYDTDGFIKDSFNAQVIEDVDLMMEIDSFMNLVLAERIKEVHDNLVDKRIIMYKPDGSFRTALLNSRALNVYTELYSRNSQAYPEDNYNNVGYAIATDYTINSMSRNIEFGKLFTGDVAYYKDTIDYKKRISATYSDGITPLLSNPTFGYAVIDAVNVKKFSNYDKMVETYGEDVAKMYIGTNAADAQAWITPDRWKELQQGLWWSETHKRVYQKMNEENPQPYTEEEFKVAAQAMKGVYFWRNEIGGAPLYFKYSQAVLTKQLVANTPLEQVVNEMITQGVSELITIDGVKVGAPKPTRLHNEDGSLNLKDLTFNVHQADSRGWKLQQDLPTKGMKETELGSQIEKNIYFAIKENPDLVIEVNGRDMTGQEIMDEMFRVFESLSNAGLKRMLNRFGFNKDGVLLNRDAFYEAFIDEVKSRNGSLSTIDALTKQLPPYAIPGVRTKLDQMFASVINKNIVKVKTNGGSFIQMANFGLSFKQVSNRIGVKVHPNLSKLTEYTDNEGYVRSSNTTFEPYVEEVEIENQFIVDDLKGNELEDIQSELDEYQEDVISSEEMYDVFIDQLIDINLIEKICD